MLVFPMNLKAQSAGNIERKRRKRKEKYLSAYFPKTTGMGEVWRTNPMMIKTYTEKRTVKIILFMNLALFITKI